MNKALALAKKIPVWAWAVLGGAALALISGMRQSYAGEVIDDSPAQSGGNSQPLVPPVTPTPPVQPVPQEPVYIYVPVQAPVAPADYPAAPVNPAVFDTNTVISILRTGTESPHAEPLQGEGLPPPELMITQTDPALEKLRQQARDAWEAEYDRKHGKE